VTDDLRRHAERALAEVREGVRLSSGDVLDERDGHVTAMRFRVQAPSDLGESVVVKRPGNWSPYDPMSDEGTAPSTFNEWAALTFLDGSEIGPRPLAFDRATGLRVIEDLGTGPTLADALLGDDHETAEQAMLATARCLGRLHASTAARVGEFNAIRDAIGPHGTWYHLPRGVARIGDVWRLLGVGVSDDATEQIDAALAAVRVPGTFEVLTHADPCPDNVFLVGGEAKLIDFETAAPRHALIDGVYGHVPFPTCWCVNALPRELRPRWEHAYRVSLGDPEGFEDAVGHAWLWWLLVSTAQLVDRAVDEDLDWGIATYRQRVVYRWSEFADATPSSSLEALARDVVARTHALWPETEPLPRYPAFR